MSCNGCRVLRKGCDGNCNLRPCLSWITSPESQANGTLFLAKFYGRAGLLNLINATPNNLRAEAFRSLLHEACGRIINPTFGSVGLIWSGNWELCQAAVDSVLQGTTIMQVLPTINNPHTNCMTATPDQSCVMPLEVCDIRHVTNNHSSNEDHREKIRNKFKRPRCDSGFQQLMVSTDGAPKCGITQEEAEANHPNLSHELLSIESVEGNYDQSGKELLDLTLGLS